MNWFNREVVRNVGNGESTRFWLDIWVGNEALCLAYPRFSLFLVKKMLWWGKFGRMERKEVLGI